MADVVVTVPKNFRHPDVPGKVGLAAWIGEGEAAGDRSDLTTLWAFSTFGPRPDIQRGERVYVTCEGRIRGYAPLWELRYSGGALGRVVFVRRGDAVAVTIPDQVTGFRGWRYRWWDLAIEVPFPEWRRASSSEVVEPLPGQRSLFI